MAYQSAPYDIIFAGGGTTACVVAGRLAAADPSLKILIIEAGKHTKDVSTHTQPGRYFRNLITGGETFTFHLAKPSEALGNRPCIIPAGKGVGGGSAVNFMMYTRASPSDYDDWENLSNPGWGAKDLIPLSNKAETFEPNAKNHGTSGPIKIMGGTQTNIAKQYLSVAAARDKERGFTDDTNDLQATSVDVYSRWYRYVSSETGRRSDAAHHYVYNQAQNKNLQILAHCRVKRVLFEGDRAVGVEYISHAPDAEDKQAVVAVYASRLVVLSGGAFGSPAILERSGIGAPDLLKAHNIPQVVDLPGVGENYNDHNLVLPPYHTPDSEITMDDIFHGTDEQIKPYEESWLRDDLKAVDKGLMAHNGIEAGIKIRPNAKELEVLGPSFSKRWQEFFANRPDKPVMWIGPLAGYTGANGSVKGKIYIVGYYTEYPASTGRTHIESTDPYANLAVEPGYLDKAEDVAVLRWSYKWSREMARRMDSYRGEFAHDHPQFPEGSAAATAKADGPVPISAPDIVYSAEDDEAIDRYHRAVVGTTWHSLGTCAMKPRDQGGVVDPRLNVYGVKNLKVADLSIAPSNVGSNTYNSALVVGEKAAVLIAEDLGIKGV
ncbi:GMC oxidoreductase-domain-containing protein [Mycena albidolilacea]|uniref:GMC oxidoreductase-domain-containing protein n=1 Tax=Mycena albidolilacea TaxID=1033008 RepID=A0AAD7ANU1_9AGAR|nr:GMC oxidoreductase-domain-containing protein [Mycena albidolilacea]